MICWAQQAGNIQFPSLPRHAVAAAFFLILRFFLTDRQFYQCRYFLQLAALITHVGYFDDASRNRYSRDVHGGSKGHNRARVDRLDSRLSYQTRLKASSLRTPEMVGHLKDIRRCDEHDDVDFRDENELRRFVRPGKWLSLNAGSVRLLRVNVRRHPRIRSRSVRIHP